MEQFTGDILQFFTKKQHLAFGRTAGNLPSNQSFWKNFLKFPNFLMFYKVYTKHNQLKAD